MKHTDLDRWRLAAGLTHAEAARKLGCSLAMFGALCRGRRRPSAVLAARIERVAGIPAGYWGRIAVERARPAPPPPVEPADDDAPF